MTIEKRIEKRQMNQEALSALLESGNAPSEICGAIKAYMDGEYLAEMDADKQAAFEAICKATFDNTKVPPLDLNKIYDEAAKGV